MKITKIEAQQFGAEDKIVVTVDGYPHAQPVFDAKITPADLEVALKAWKINQDEVDAINAQAVLDAKDKVEKVVVKPELNALINKEIKL